MSLLVSLSLLCVSVCLSVFSFCVGVAAAGITISAKIADHSSEHRLCICLRVHVCEWCVLLHQGFALQNDLRSIKYKSYQLFLLLQYEELVYVVFFCYCNLKSFLRHIPFGGRGGGGLLGLTFQAIMYKNVTVYKTTLYKAVLTTTS